MANDIFANHHDFIRRKAEHADREAKAKGHDAAAKERIASEQKRREDMAKPTPRYKANFDWSPR